MTYAQAPEWGGDEEQHEVNKLSENHMVRRCLALLFPSALPSRPMAYLVRLNLEVGLPLGVDKTLKSPPPG